MTKSVVMFDTNKMFDPKTDYIIDNRVFRNVKVQHVREYEDWDTSHQKISYLHGKDADYTTWQKNGRLYMSEKAYHKAKKKVIDGRVFDSVLSNKMMIDGTRIYENRLPDGGVQKITVSAGGDILSVKSYPKIKPSFMDRLARGLAELTYKFR